MRQAAILTGLLLTLPAAAAQAAPGEITPMARYCAEALVDSRLLMTSAMIATTAKEAGRPDADERTEFFVVPHEDLVFSRLQVSGLSACSVYPMDGAEGWTEASVNDHLQALNLLVAPECDSDEGHAFWFSQLPNLKRRGVTVVVDRADGAVNEILAFETPDLSRPSDCLKGQSE